ncbi:conserved hypothetical protein [Frankia canadensis]|uniref:Uncharacterized protein n=1 Tax=Frankia canadensis TaxID=1836972 RepID=A0A2I2L244_9ACTN|nr:hypothetical protein [Frankia canadensis]SNQ51937.1 conserved hypothetical protein [Frankia canadensis]SOU59227.1 conserved hypothetical protein [Frankia canadensis]
MYVYDWPDEPPPPRLVAAWRVLGTMPAERVPFWAADWLIAGWGDVSVAELAGLSGRDPRAVDDLLAAALDECGPDRRDLDAEGAGRERAAGMIAFTAIAEMHAAGRVTERWVATVVSTIVGTIPNESLSSLPLGRIHFLADEWEFGWGRSGDELRHEIQQACRTQLDATFETTKASPARNATAWWRRSRR